MNAVKDLAAAEPDISLRSWWRVNRAKRRVNTGATFIRWPETRLLLLMCDESVLCEVKLLFQSMESGGLEESVTAILFGWIKTEKPSYSFTKMSQCVRIFSIVLQTLRISIWACRWLKKALLVDVVWRIQLPFTDCVAATAARFAAASRGQFQSFLYALVIRTPIVLKIGSSLEKTTITLS